jgi:hypothetical protein
MADEVERDEAGRFPPGQSGNRRGRPRKDKSVHAAILAAANEKVPLGKSGKKARKLDIAARQVATQGAQGDPRMGKMLFDLTTRAEESQAVNAVAKRLTRSDEEIVAQFLAEYRRHLGVEEASDDA